MNIIELFIIKKQRNVRLRQAHNIQKYIKNYLKNLGNLQMIDRQLYTYRLSKDLVSVGTGTVVYFVSVLPLEVLCLLIIPKSSIDA